MNRDIKYIKGVGPARAKVLEEIGIKTVGDLLHYFPRRFIDKSITEEADLQTGNNYTLVVRIVNSYLAHGRMSRLLVHCRTLRGDKLTLVFFKGVQFYRNTFETDAVFVVYGKLDFYQGLQMSHPDFEALDSEDENNLVHVGRIIPLYASNETLKKSRMDSRGFRRLLDAALKLEDLNVPDPLPPKLAAKYKFQPRREAFQSMHFPADEAEMETGRRRFIYEELYLFHQLMYRKKQAREAIKRELWPLPWGKSPGYKKLLPNLPFTLTGDQTKAIEKIISSTQADHGESFLLQGDVGSGKTVVALAIALHYIDNNIQVALMAPTEVLAKQHFRTLSNLTGLLGDVQVELITGKGRKKEKELTLDRIARGEANLVIGTHSLIEAPVVFDALGLVIIDEQHRFGVEQRETLRQKGKNPDMIVMTATPIPRTLSLTGFADLNLVSLKEKPAGRGQIKTLWLDEDKRTGMYKSVRKYVAKGQQCYIVYPIIDDSEKSDLRAATDGHEELQNAIFPDYKVALLHGRMKPAEKDLVMQEFNQGNINILVATTVIEVGVDVPNASVMVIEHAERFGISQLHQLRGRVGRGTNESFCVLMASDVGEDAKSRMEAIVNSNDGFYLAEVDMGIRGPGQLLGLKQHGLPGFRVADLVRDSKVSEQAYEDVRKIQDLNEEALSIIRRNFSEGITVFPT